MRPELPFELSASRVIAIVRIARPEFLPVLAAYLWDAGVGTIEVPVTMNGAAAAIFALSATPATVGAGEVDDVPKADAAIDAGARFVSFPIEAPAVIRRCVERGVAAIPTARTSAEVEVAWLHGASAVKLECGSAGPSRTRDVARALPGVPLVAVGGIDDRTAAEHIRAGAGAVAADEWLVADAVNRTGMKGFHERARRLVAGVAGASLDRGPGGA